MKPLHTFSLLISAAILLSACGGSRETRVTRGTEQVGNAPTGTLFATSSASIVHVDERERIATIRHGRTIPDGTFLKALDRTGEQTGLLKIQPAQATGLRTAYILEGEPAISDAVSKVSAAESQRLKQRYPEGDSD